MKLVCSTTVFNRLLPSLAIKSKKKSTKSTVALCKHPKSDKYYLFLFTGQDKNGMKYDLNQNIENVLTKFVNDGKTTIQFKNPPHDLFIQADKIQLKSFLHLLHKIVKGTVTVKDLTICSSLNVTPVKEMAVTKMVIKNRSEYPIKGFPRTLESLTITKISRMSLDVGILKLSKLKVLNLSENLISELPKEFGNLLLQELDISKNKFCECSKRNWKWINGKISRTLRCLNMESNALQYVPESLTKLQNLTDLNLSKNFLSKLPAGIGTLKNLKNLNVSHNSIEILPGSMRVLKLDVLDISHNKFIEIPTDNQLKLSKKLVCTLKEYAAMSVLNHKIFYNSELIPGTLVDFLDEEAKYCVCGKSCFSFHYYKIIQWKPSYFAKTVINSDRQFFTPLSCYYCSMTCVNFQQMNRRILIR